MANKNETVSVIREVKVTVGGVEISRDGRNIRFAQGDTVIAIPNGAVASAFLTEAAGFVTNEAPAKGKTAKNAGTGEKRKRRTKAEMEAARAEEEARKAAEAGNTPAARVENTVGNDSDEELEVL